MNEKTKRQESGLYTTDDGVKWNEYERQKDDWLVLNRQATPQQYIKAMVEIARRIGI